MADVLTQADQAWGRGDIHAAATRLYAPDVAVVNQRWRMTAGSQDQAPIRGMGLLVLTRLKGGWKVIAAEGTITRAGEALPRRNDFQANHEAD